jgi:formate hydrogenlyase subunit 3/multisubunit Na+/H+ antiporter MnhD subunit
VSPIAGPLLLVALPLLASVITYVVRRWSLLAALVSSLTTGMLAILSLILPLDRSALVLGREVAFGRPIVILGRTLILDPAGQVWLAFAFGLATIFYLFAWRMSQGHSFFPFSLSMLSLYSVMVLLQTFPLAVIVFACTVPVGVLIIQAGQRGSIRGAQRYLVVTLLATMLLLAANWLVGQAADDPASAELARQALLPAGLGFGLLLAAFPFSTWMPAVAADSPPVITAFVFVTGQAMALFLALRFLQDSSLALSDPAIASGIRLAGLAMAFVGGAMAAAQQDLSRLLGYAALSDLGFVLLALGVAGRQGLTLALLHTVNRSVAIILFAAALSIVRHRATTDHFARLGGVARRLPVATMGLMLGGLALAGFPFTSGFATHWAISRAAWNWVQPFSPLTDAVGAGLQGSPGQGWVWVLTLLALLTSSIGIVIGLLRGLSFMLGATTREDLGRQPRVATLMVLALAGLATILALYPQLLLEPIQRAAQTFSLF